MYITQGSTSQCHGVERRNIIARPASAVYATGGDTGEILRSASGEFDNDESDEIVAKVRASKSMILQGTGPTGVQPSHLASYAAKAGIGAYSTTYIPLALWTEIMQCYYLFHKLDD